MTRTLTIYRPKRESHWWTDPWGRKEIAEVVDEVAVITETADRYRHNNGYTTDMVTVYVDQQGRRWAAIPPMDFGGSTGYLALSPSTDDTVLRWWSTFVRGRRIILPDNTPITSEEQLRSLA